MSEYQYYEFQALDRPLSAGDRQALRAMSSRAQITATSFTNSYDWGSFKGDPAKLVEQWFDLHLYLANWGSRRLMIKWPARYVDRHVLLAFLGEVDCAEVKIAGENIILDVSRDREDAEEWEDADEWEEEEGWEDGSGRLACLAPLRADVLAGDLRLFYLLWLTAVENDTFEADEPEPLPGIGPITGALEAFAAFFGIDRDLVQAAAERASVPTTAGKDDAAAHRTIAAMAEADKTELLVRLFEGDPHVASELRAEVRKRLDRDSGAAPRTARTVGDLRTRARAIGLARERAHAEAAAAERRRIQEEEAKARRARLAAVERRGEAAWRDVETDIERRDAGGYARATALLSDLERLAEQRGTAADFMKRLDAIRERHARKRGFIERLAEIGRSRDGTKE